MRQPGWETLVRQGAAEYRDHPAFGGYFVDDEPTAPEFDALAKVVGILQDGNRDLAHINLLPDYFPNAIGAPTYRDYVEQFILSVRPRFFSYDHYPFRISGDRPSFFANLSQVRELALQHDVPFMLVGLAMPHLDYRDPTEAELSWQAFHALAFGARGLSYFAYWTPVNVQFADRMRFRQGLIEKGVPTRHYAEARRVNAMVRAAARELERFRSVAVADSLAQVAGPLPPGPLAGVAGGPITVGLFEDDGGQLAALLVNRDYRRDTSITLRLRDAVPAPQQFDFNEESWRAGSDRLQIPAGKAALFRWPAASR